MIRGTTPTHTFDLPVNKDIVKDIRITYVQNDEIIIEKKLRDVTLYEGKVETTLSQADTLKFKAQRSAFVQLRVLTTKGQVFASNSEAIAVHETFNEEILS